MASESVNTPVASISSVVLPLEFTLNLSLHRVSLPPLPPFFRGHTPSPHSRNHVAEYVRLLRHFRINHIFMLNSKEEARDISGIYDLPQFYADCGFAVTHRYIEDGQDPALQTAVINDVVQRILDVAHIQDRRILVHCSAGLGRTGMVLACVGLAANAFRSPAEAIAHVQQSIPGALQNPAKIRFVSEFRWIPGPRSPPLALPSEAPSAANVTSGTSASDDSTVTSKVVTRFDFPVPATIYRGCTPLVYDSEDIAAYLRVLRSLRITHIFMLNKEKEARSICGIARLPRFYQDCGFQVSHTPIRDFSKPDPQLVSTLVLRVIAVAGDANHRILVHCSAGLGRTGMIMACLGIALKSYSSPPDAITQVQLKIKGALLDAEFITAVSEFQWPPRRASV